MKMEDFTKAANLKSQIDLLTALRAAALKEAVSITIEGHSLNDKIDDSIKESTLFPNVADAIADQIVLLKGQFEKL